MPNRIPASDHVSMERGALKPDRNPSRLLVVTPIKDEIQIVERMVESVLRQTTPFLEWVLVDDGSTDGTGEFLQTLAASTASVTLVPKTDRSDRRVGRHVASVVEQGLAKAHSADWHYWAKIDADLVLAPDYFEQILARLKADPRLGIASGKALLPGRAGTWRNEWTPEYYPLGMARIYRRECWLDIGGYRGDRHFDIVDVYEARLRGWRTVSIPETHAMLLRRVEARMPGQLRRRFEAGSDLYAIGYHPGYFLLRAARSMWDERPLGLAGFAMACGYVRGAMLGVREVGDELFQFVRQDQRRMLKVDRVLSYARVRLGRADLDRLQ